MHSTGVARRTDIQGLRAIAVLFVLAYHFRPNRVSGGFVGVDVFFVISGYLISGLLFRELEATGRIRLSAFYARRVRRLMPAALTTLFVTCVAAALIVGPVRLVGVLTDAAWTSAYLANVHFAQSPDGYFATGEQSPLLHFWSLAVEEQFYLVAPVMLILLARARSWPRWAVPLLVVVLGGSLSLSVLWVGEGSTNAYYSLGSRAWELAVGAVLAWVVGQGRILPGPLASAAGWVGLAAVSWSALAYTSATPFPGVAATVPTLGTALMLWSGVSRTGLLQRLLSVSPARFVGDISYSLYLWHWPVWVLGGVLAGGSIGRGVLASMLAVVFVLAWASYRLLEQPVGRWRPGAGPRVVVGNGAAVAAAAALVALSVSAVVPTSSGLVEEGPVVPSDLRLTSEASPIRFAITGPGVTPNAVPVNVTPPLAQAPHDLAEVFTNGCFDHLPAVNVGGPCQGGDPAGRVRVVLAGDSMAGAWWPAVNSAAKQHGWRLFMVGKNGCPLADVPISLGVTGQAWPECSEWQAAAPRAIAGLHPDLIIWAAHTTGYQSKVSLAGRFTTAWPAGVQRTMRQLTATSRVLFMGQTPRMPQTPSECLSEHLSAVRDCSQPVDAVVSPRIRAMNEALAAGSGAAYVQLVCSDVCPVMSSNVAMYRDIAHLGAVFSARLAPRMGVVITAALKQRRRCRVGAAHGLQALRRPEGVPRSAEEGRGVTGVVSGGGAVARSSLAGSSQVRCAAYAKKDQTKSVSGPSSRGVRRGT